MQKCLWTRSVDAKRITQFRLQHGRQAIQPTLIVVHCSWTPKHMQSILQAALIMQVLQLTDQQIAMLPPEQRQSILILKDQLSKNQWCVQNSLFCHGESCISIKKFVRMKERLLKKKSGVWNCLNCVIGNHYTFPLKCSLPERKSISQRSIDVFGTVYTMSIVMGNHYTS